jgi:hypothetical protein
MTTMGQETTLPSLPSEEEVLAIACRAATNRLSNWQRQKWAQAGYPGAHDKPEAIIKFAELNRARP